MAEQLRTVTLGNSDLETSTIGYGTYHLKDKLDEYDAVRSMGEAFEQGITLFDTSDNYGSEALVGIAVREGFLPRDEVVIATKTGLGTSYAHQVALNTADKRGDTSPDRIRSQVDKSLLILGKDVDVIDLYQLHIPDPTVEPVEHAAVMAELIEAGKIRAYGVSNYSAADITALMQACEEEGLPKPVTSQPFFNIVGGYTDAVAAAHESGLTVLAHSPLLKGILSQHTVDMLKMEILIDEHEAGADAPEGLHVFKQGLESILKLRAYAESQGLTLPQLALAWPLGRPNTVTLTSCTNERYLNDATIAARAPIDVADPELKSIVDGFDEASFTSLAINVMRGSKYYYR